MTISHNNQLSPYLNSVLNGTEECRKCLGPMDPKSTEPDEIVGLLKCGHAYHLRCIQETQEAALANTRMPNLRNCMTMNPCGDNAMFNVKHPDPEDTRQKVQLSQDQLRQLIKAVRKKNTILTNGYAAFFVIPLPFALHLLLTKGIGKGVKALALQAGANREKANRIRSYTTRTLLVTNPPGAYAANVENRNYKKTKQAITVEYDTSTQTIKKDMLKAILLKYSSSHDSKKIDTLIEKFSTPVPNTPLSLKEYIDTQRQNTASALS